MPRITYVRKTFKPNSQQIILRANEIIDHYARQGFDLTLRQLYYQFVSRDWFPESWQDPTTHSTNNKRSYDKLGVIVSDARRAGLIDWDRIVDRTRNLRAPASWSGPEAIVRACADQFDVDWWGGQEYRPEVYVEKDALIGVIETACEPWHCPYFSCRGYVSDSEAWAAAQRLDRWIKKGQTPIIFHLGDHDPSGIDMTRDITDRLKMFVRRPEGIEVRRLALTMDQVQQYNPPPNPAKETDARFVEYRRNYGNESWELDALEPTTIAAVIAREMEGIIDQAAWSEAEVQRDEGRRLLGEISSNWKTVTEGL